MERADIAGEYLRTLGLKEQAPTLSFVGNIIRRHVATFAFCSVGPRLGDELPLDLNSLYQRIVIARRGGYCFEQNGLLYEILEELGFDVRLYLGRVIYGQDIHPGLTHRISVVEIDGDRYVADVGFGASGPSIPVPMSAMESHDRYRTFRVHERRPGEFHMQILKEREFFSLYRFELARYGPADCEVGHFYSHKHPNASFVNHLVVSRILDGEVRSLRDREMCVTTESGDRRSEIHDAGALRSILVEKLGVQVTKAECQYLFDNAPRPDAARGG